MVLVALVVPLVLTSACAGRDLSFDRDGLVRFRDESVESIAVRPDGSLLVATGNAAVASVVSLRRDGAVDAGFGRSGRVSFGPAVSPAVAAIPDGGAIVAVQYIQQTDSFDLVRLTRSGQLVAGFGPPNTSGPAGTGVSGSPVGLVVDAGRITLVANSDGRYTL